MLLSSLWRHGRVPLLVLKLFLVFLGPGPEIIVGGIFFGVGSSKQRALHQCLPHACMHLDKASFSLFDMIPRGFLTKTPQRSLCNPEVACLASAGPQMNEKMRRTMSSLPGFRKYGPASS